MKKIVVILLLGAICSHNLFATEQHEFNNFSVSLDPISFIALLFSSLGTNDEENPTDFRNVWFCAGVNWETEKQREMGLEIFIRGDRVGITTKYRFFSNRERQSGFFWGLFGLFEWRRMYWYYDEDSELNIAWRFPFTANENVYHSIGITGGLDTGFRLRLNNFGITPYLRLGVPLFFCFGNLPQSSREEFRNLNILVRAISIGIRLNFFL